MASPSELLEDISGGKFKPVYYFYGSEDYRIVEAEKYLAREFLPQAQYNTNYRRIDGKRTPCADLIADLSNLPMLGERQVFAISDFQSYSAKEIERILALLSPPDPNRVVILSSPSVRCPDRRSKFMATISQTAEPVEFRRLSGREVASKVKAGLTKAGLRIDRDALAMLVELIAGSRGALDAELAKLIDFKQEGGLVTSDDVGAVTAGFEVYNVFELADRIIEGRTGDVLKMIRSLLAGGNTPVGILALIQQHFICLYLAKNGKKPLRRREFLIGKYRQQSAGFESDLLENIIVTIAEIDGGLRRGGIKPEIALEMLALSLSGDKR